MKGTQDPFLAIRRYNTRRLARYSAEIGQRKLLHRRICQIEIPEGDVRRLGKILGLVEGGTPFARLPGIDGIRLNVQLLGEILDF